MKTKITITFNGAQITSDVNGRILSAVYTDAEEGQTDDFQFEIDDREGIWVGGWLDADTLSRKAALTASFTVSGESGEKTLSCGSFEVDSVVFSGPPRRLTIKGTSLGYLTAMRHQEKSRTWEAATLSSIAADLCAAGGLELKFYSSTDPLLEAAEQYEMTDAEFLWRLVQDAGMHIKSADGAMIIYDDSYLDGAPTVKTIAMGESDLLSWNLETNALERVYSKCVVQYTEPETGAVIEGEYGEGEGEGDMPVLRIDQKVENAEEAKTLAQSYFNRTRKEAFTGSFTMIGDPDLVVGVSVTLAGFGAFDGDYTISQAVHAVSGGSYTTQIQVKRL